MVTDLGYNLNYYLKYNNETIQIQLMFNTENCIFFKIKDVLYKIERTKINFTVSSNTINNLPFFSNSDLLLKFSNQSQLALILQILAPGLLFTKTDLGIYGALAVSLFATIIHVNAFSNIKSIALIDSAIEYPY